MNLIISAIVGGLVAGFATIGGVSAYEGSPEGVAENSLYSYADN